jgi:hypothetical protein
MGGTMEQEIASSKGKTEQTIVSKRGLVGKITDGAKSILGGKKRNPRSPNIESKTLKGDSQSLRVHLSSGEIHFHDDKQKLKVAMPFADWWSAWNRLSCLSIRQYEYLDRERGTVLTVSVDGAGGLLEANVILTKEFKKIPVELGPTFKKLDSYINKGSK